MDLNTPEFSEWDLCLDAIRQYENGTTSLTRALATIEHFEFDCDYCEITGLITLKG
jgi:hypothetical protein